MRYASVQKFMRAYKAEAKETECGVLKEEIAEWSWCVVLRVVICACHCVEWGCAGWLRPAGLIVAPASGHGGVESVREAVVVSVRNVK